MIIKILIIALICLNISITSADYKYKIEDRIKINSVDEKISKYISHKKNSYFLAKRLKNKIEKILGKSEKEIIEKYNNRKSKYKDFKEFALTDIYGKIKTINIPGVKKIGQYYYYTYKETILENDYIKILVDKKYIKGSNIELNNKSLTTTYSDGNKRKHLEFFEIKPEEKTKNYINKHFIKNNECSVIKSKNKGIKGLDFYYIGKISEINNNKGEGLSDCGEYGIGWGKNFFYRLSSNIIIYTTPTQEYEGFDISSMEVK